MRSVSDLRGRLLYGIELAHVSAGAYPRDLISVPVVCGGVF